MWVTRSARSKVPAAPLKCAGELLAAVAAELSPCRAVSDAPPRITHVGRVFQEGATGLEDALSNPHDARHTVGAGRRQCRITHPGSRAPAVRQLTVILEAAGSDPEATVELPAPLRSCAYRAGEGCCD